MSRQSIGEHRFEAQSRNRLGIESRHSLGIDKV